MRTEEKILIEYMVSNLHSGRSVEEVRSALTARRIHATFQRWITAVEFTASQLLLGFPPARFHSFLSQQRGFEAAGVDHVIQTLMKTGTYISDEMPFQEDPTVAQAQLLVVGDSHSRFWSGGEDAISVYRKPPDRLPGILTTMVGSPLAWNLARENTSVRGREKTLMRLQSARAHGFRGWIMLCFGEIDLRWHILRSAATLGMAQAVRACVDRYITFIHEVRAMHDAVAIWGPAASIDGANSDAFPAVGTVEDRNYATMLFTELLRQKSGVPVLSVLDSTLLDNGRTRTALFFDGVHLSQTVMPHALDIAQQTLGLNLTGCADVPGFLHQDVSDRVLFQEDVTCEGRRCLLCDMRPFPVHIVSFDMVGPAHYDAENPLYLFTSNDQKSFTSRCLMPDSGVLHLEAHRTLSLTLHESTRFLYLSYGAHGKPNVRLHARVGFLNLKEIQGTLSLASMRGMVRACLA